MTKKNVENVYEQFKKYCAEKNATLPLRGEVGFFSTNRGIAYVLLQKKKVLVFNTRTGNEVINDEFAKQQLEQADNDKKKLQEKR